MKVLVMGGAGKVGAALVNALKNAHEVQIVEVNSKPEVQKFDVLHVAIPWQGDFVSKVNAVVKEFKVGLVINHSTVPPGTTKAIGPDAVHSPILGQHDDLENELFRFTKWVGASSEKIGRLAVSHLAMSGIDARMMGTPNDTETLKLLCLFRYMNDLAFYETAGTVLDSLKVNRNLLNVWTSAYNDGYKGTKFSRALLSFPNGKIGGSCVAQNSKILFEITKNEGIKKDLELFKLI
ncbi:MAG: hypothetical protein IPJ55_16865 [Chloracidobacterium sp.]|nr:hypothetical protein [Chloracidobacterium sp.]